jgi:leucyl-tRNA synthetase
MQKYDHKKIEAKWQKYWAAKKTFLAKDFSKKPKKYILTEFPYPSGEGLHMGHLRPYVAGDVYSRFNRLKGFETLFPMGWDAFGLPAENYAIKTGVNPAITTKRNIKNAKKQMQAWGLSFDWSREVNTTDPEYYKWTQWLFLQFYKAGLAYEATGLINWCPKDKTGLANEEVIDGRCERCGTLVVKKELRQWYLKITAYAEKLLEGLKNLPQWPEAVKLQQANWIGKSVGAEIDFYLNFKKNPSDNNRRGPDGKAAHISVFTTRPDTIFGATYLVMAPEHPWVALATDNSHEVLENKQEVKKYIQAVSQRSEIERTAEGKDKTGVEAKGVKAINPATGQEIPIWVADYVLGHYGTGAIMAVPQHDERDRQFAEKYKLPIIDKPLMPIAEAIKKFGKEKVQYKLRDWVFSRQRYWGEPIPIIHCPSCGIVPVPEKDLPVKLPPVKKYEPTGTGESPLADIKSFVNVKCPVCKGPAKRETNTMPQWAGSSWYWLRYTDPHDKKSFADIKKQKYWTPVDVYFGGMEHTTLHLLYSRFWNLFLYDQKLVTSREPYIQRKPHGLILAADGEKMSKSKGNFVNPDDIVKSYGADTLRMYELFLGPHEASVSWNDQGIVGVKRFLDRVWNWAGGNGVGVRGKGLVRDTEKVQRELNKLVKKITEDLEAFHFNTCISAFMEFYNQVKDEAISTASIKTFLILLYPFAPHISEELYQQIGGKKSLQLEAWPNFDEKLTVDSTAEIVVQINGKVKGKLVLPTGATQDKAQAVAMELEPVKQAVAGQSIKRTVYVPNRLINFVV